MGEAAAAGEEGEGVMHRRVQFQAARRPQAAGRLAGGFRPERLYPDADKRVAAAVAQSGRWEKGEGSGSGFDPELTAARTYLRRIGAGLRNLGNTCYLNSVLQCLTYTEPFVAYLQSGKHKSSCRTTGFCALCALQNHVRCALQSTGKILTPMQFVKNLRCISHSFRNSRQEDAHELMVNLLESMHKSCLPSGIPSQSPSAYEKSLVHRIFGGRLRSQVRCASCSHCSSKFDPFLDLSLEIANAATLVKALENFTEEELLDGGEKQYNCQHCRQKVVAKKSFTIDKAPDVLTIHLKRFSPFNPRRKIDKKVDFQPTLNLKPFVNNPEGMDFKYSLYGVLVHAGWNTQSGHYYCFVQTSSGIWHNLDDNQVYQVREADVLRQKAYMLFYVRDRVQRSMMSKDNGTNNFFEKNVVSEKTTCMNGTTQNGRMEMALNVTSFINGDVKLWKQNSDDGHPSIISKSSQGQCPKNHTSTGVIEAVASQNNVMVSVQKAPCMHPDAAATLSYKTSSNSQTEITSPSHPSAIILHDSNCDHKAHENPLQEHQLQSDYAFIDSSKGITPALPICNGADRLSGANVRAPESEINPFGKPIPNIGSTGINAQITQTKDSAVSNGSKSSREDHTCCNEAKSAKPVNQHDEVVMAKELSVEKTVAIANTEEQASLQNNEVEVVQVNSEKQIHPEDSTQVIYSEVSAHAICSEDSAQGLDKDECHGSLHQKMDIKLKRHAKKPAFHLFFGSKQLLLSALKLRKKRKHKRTTRWSTFSMDIENIADDQQTSTSETVLTGDVPCKSHRLKRSRASLSSDNGDQMFNNKQHHAGDTSSAADIPMDKKDNMNATPANAELPSSVAGQTNPRNCVLANDRVPSHFDLLTRGLREITVPRWDDLNTQNTKATEFQYLRTSSIGYVYVPDQWDEEYDHGRKKKPRKSKEQQFSGSNPFQEKGDIKSRQRKRLKSDHAKSGNQTPRT